jgi:uncharacterized protein (DUF983 family)
MKYTIHCPACEQGFNFFRLVNKFYILRPRCPHCRSVLKVSGMGIYTFFLLMLFGMVAVLYMQRQVTLGQPINFLIPIGLVLLYEFFSALLICNKGKFVVHRNHYIKTPEKPNGIEE